MPETLLFSLCVPFGYGRSAGIELPDVEETDSPKEVFCARFGCGAEVWWH